MSDNIYIFNDSIYISKDYITLLKPNLKSFIELNSSAAAEPGSGVTATSNAAQENVEKLAALPLPSGYAGDGPLAQPEAGKVAQHSAADSAFVLNINDKNFYFFISISDLLMHNNSELEAQIDLHNKKIVPMDKNKYFEIWDFFKKYY